VEPKPPAFENDNNHETSEHRPTDDESAESGVTAVEGLLFEVGTPFRVQRVPCRPLARLTRYGRVALPLLLAVVVLAVSQPQLGAALKRLLSATPNAWVSVIANVPWAAARADDGLPPAHFAQDGAGTLPTATIAVAAGRHMITVTAEGFEPLRLSATVSAGQTSEVEARLTLNAQGRARVLAAVNAYFAQNGYTQRVRLPPALWPALPLPPPASGELLLDESFVAVSLDTYAPVYLEGAYRRPVSPAAGAVGVAVVVEERSMFSDDCSTTPLAEFASPILSGSDAAMVFSVVAGKTAWVASRPFALNPAADLYTDPSQAATPATPLLLLALAARTHLAAALGSASLLALALSARAYVAPAVWPGGVVLSTTVAPRSPERAGYATDLAAWFYAGGLTKALTPSAASLTPSLSRLAPAGSLPSSLNASAFTAPAC
jgi:hypothetical protein